MKPRKPAWLRGAKSIAPNHFSVMQPGPRITALARRAGITGGRAAIYAWAKSIGWKIG